MTPDRARTTLRTQPTAGGLMHRRALALPSLLVAAALAAGACAAATSPGIADPAEILTKAVTSLQAAKTVHLEATIDGTVKLDLAGNGTGGDIALTGTKISVDLDIADSDIHATLAVPALLGLTADAIVVGSDTYLKSSLTGDKYARTPMSTLGVPLDVTNPLATIVALKEWLAKPEVGPRKLADAACGSKTCYQVEIDLTADEIRALMPDPSAAPAGDGGVNLTVLTERDTLRLAGATIKVTSSDVGEVTFKVLLSNWDAPLTITAPPADQVK
ncbi:MAG: hypothetical protein ABIV26_01980 [Candidatus Limnocylindrales bacterium]